MIDYKISISDYKIYLINLRSSVFKILPLYEDGNKFLDQYICDVIKEVVKFKEMSHHIPNTKEIDWYIKIILTLEVIKDEVKTEKHSQIKKKVLFITNKIQRELEAI